MGLGKTIQALVLILSALTCGQAKRVLVVVPLSVLKNWENEFMKWSDNGAMLENRGMGICIVHGAMNKKKNMTKEKVRIDLPFSLADVSDGHMLAPGLLSRGWAVFYHLWQHPNQARCLQVHQLGHGPSGRRPQDQEPQVVLAIAGSSRPTL